MRVLKSAKWVSCLAASGGLVLILSGNAMASDADPAVMIEADKTASVSVSQEQTSVSSDQAVVTVSKQSTQATQTAVAPTPAATVGDTSTLAKETVAAAKTTPEAVMSSIPATPEEVAVAPAALPTDKQNGPMPVVPVAPTGYRTMPALPVVNDVYHAPMNESPAQLPTAAAPAAPNKAPAPAEPTGALGQLSAQLAGSVIKPVFLPEPASLGLGSYLTMSIFLMILTVRVVAAAFGFATRRDGYAHAARSDVAVTTNPIFATPSSLSYVTATRQHATHF